MIGKKCLIVGCEGGASARGLCANCYYKAKRLIKNGKTTWKILEQKGMATVSRKTIDGNPFMKQFNNQ